MILFALTFAWCFFAQAHDMNAMCVYNADDSVHHVVANIDSITFGNSATEVSDEPAPTVGKAIDLGLSVKWASCNVGATAPEGYGDYYAWGETDTKSDYSWSTYIWCNGSGRTLTKYCTDSSYGNVDNKITLDSDDDVAHVEWGGSWRMPTLDEIKEAAKKAEKAENVMKMEEISIEDFAKIELKAAKILTCEPVPKAKKLLKLTLDDGSGTTRTVASGIAKWYKPEELIGHTVIVVSNLKPAKLCGVDSFGMILASGEEDVKVVFIDDSVKCGERIR